MSRALSTVARRALAGEETGEVFLLLLTITNVGLAFPIRLVNDTQDLTRTRMVDGFPVEETFLACPFQITLPEDREDELGRVTLAVDNVDRNIVAALRTVASVPAVSLEVVLASSPTTVEAGPFAFSLRDCTYDAFTVSGTLMFEDLLNEAYPTDTMNPAMFPSLF